ncbi:MAG: cyclophilin-like fold protein [Sphaerochaetaceae bacterium]|nr:cyclophilin-like fold protein [uncultured Sphaerochaeta sp.]MDC7228755.1 cyclophilin-like fold protein [Sphaerochaetaceae bacterium]
MKRIGIIIMMISAICCVGLLAQGRQASDEQIGEKGVVMIVMHFNEEELLIHLFDNPTSRNLVRMLPLTLTFKDYASTEKVAYLAEELSTENAPDGYEPTAGDLTLYAPWGNLALFYRDFSYSRGLIPIGTIEVGSEKLLKMKEDFTAILDVQD